MKTKFQNLKRNARIDRVCCENWQAKAKGDIILVRDHAACWQFHAQNFIRISNYCGNITLHRSRCFLFPSFCFCFFIVTQISDDFWATSYYFFKISKSRVKKFFVARLSMRSYMAFHWSAEWLHWQSLKWGAKTVNFFLRRKTRGLFLCKLNNRVCSFVGFWWNLAKIFVRFKRTKVCEA